MLTANCGWDRGCTHWQGRARGDVAHQRPEKGYFLAYPKSDTTFGQLANEHISVMQLLSDFARL